MDDSQLTWHFAQETYCNSGIEIKKIMAKPLKNISKLNTMMHMFIQVSN